MSQTTLEILDRLTSFWPSADERMANQQKRVGQPEKDPIVVRTTYTKGDAVISDSETVMPPDVSFYRYVKGTAIADDGATHEYTHRFESDPKSDAAAQQQESVECQALVQAELDRWLAAKETPVVVDEPVAVEPVSVVVETPEPVVVADQSTEASAALNLLNQTNPQ